MPLARVAIALAASRRGAGALEVAREARDDPAREARADEARRLELRQEAPHRVRVAGPHRRREVPVRVEKGIARIAKLFEDPRELLFRIHTASVA